MAKFQFTPLTSDQEVITARLGAGTGAGNQWTGQNELGKFVKLAGDSRFDLCAAGNPIEGIVLSTEAATLDNYTIGSVQVDGRVAVTFDGLEATPGTGVVAIGDYVVTGTAVAKGTALAAAAKVTKATVQPGAVMASLTEAGRLGAIVAYAWRVVSLGSAGSGAVGTTGLIERVGA